MYFLLYSVPVLLALKLYNLISISIFSHGPNQWW